MIKTWVTTVFIVSVPVWVVLLVGAQLYLSNDLVTSGGRVQALDREKETLLKDNMRMYTLVSSKISLVSLETQAESLGFVHPGRVLVVQPEGELPVALGNR